MIYELIGQHTLINYFIFITLLVIAVLTALLLYGYNLHLSTRKKTARLYAIEAVFLLETFAEKCVRVSGDWGEPLPDGTLRTRTDFPAPEINRMREISYYLPLKIVQKQFELFLAHSQGLRIISDAYDESTTDTDDSHYFFERQCRATFLGIKALLISRRIRTIFMISACTRPYGSRSGAEDILWQEWRRQRRMVARDGGF
ncbi:hypothetical protein ACO03_21330 (plasmid) [Pantoea ananatis]|nr:hypothetical protein ACO03_21330 [Pantoea ananatis]